MSPEKLKRERYSLLFAVRRSQRYHEHRRKHFDRWHRIATIGAFAFSSAAIGALALKLPGIFGIALAAAIAVLSAIDLIIGSAMRARDHHDFERRWVELERRILASGDYSEAALTSFKQDRLAIEADEPPVLRILDVICHNEVVRAEGRREYEHDVGPLQRFLAQWFDWRPNTI